MTTTRTSSAYYSIGDDRLSEITDRVVAETVRAATSREIYDQIAAAVSDYVVADWPEGDEHQRWLDTAPVAEIASWVMYGLDGRIEYEILGRSIDA